MDRRRFLQRALVASAGGALMGGLPARASLVQPARPAAGPYGPLAAEPDANGLLLPAGFTSRIIAVSGEPVADTAYAWHAFPDGSATFPTDDGGWIYVCNSEVFDFMAPDAGGASAIRFAADGSIVDAYRVLEGSNSNCAGGPTPWGTWLSCEENFGESGRVWECDPTGARPAVAHPAMGLFAHEAVAVDPESRALYLTQDNPEGLLYRFTPTGYPDLSAGTLEACVVAADGAVSWQQVPDPSGTSVPTRLQAPDATRFNGGEGIWYHDGWIWFTSKGDHSVHGIDLRAQRYTLLWRGDPDGLGVEGAVLSGVDNITVDDGSGDLYVAEDGANMEVVMITPDGAVAPFARVVDPAHDGSEITGPCFDPSGERLYFSSERGPTPKPLRDFVPGFTGDAAAGGMTFEVTGPFRGRRPVAVTSPTTTSTAAATTASSTTTTQPTTTGPTTVPTTPAPTTTLQRAAAGDDDGGTNLALPLGIGAAVVVGAAAAVVIARRRGAGPAESGPDAGA